MKKVALDMLSIGVGEQHSFFHILAKEFHNIQNICERVHEGNLHEGDDWHCTNSVKNWTCLVDGKVITFKEKIEGIHEEKKLIKYSIFDGDIGQNYKLFKSNVQVTETNNESASVKWTIEYEKINEDLVIIFTRHSSPTIIIKGKKWCNHEYALIFASSSVSSSFIGLELTYFMYVNDGKVITFKERIEAIDEEKKLIKYSIFDGDIGQNYKLFKDNVQVTETNNESASVKWTIEYEKINEDVKSPYGYLEFLEKSTIEVGDHLHKA
ncbi:hypothetical protein Ahy_B07g088131 isoform A [Arachis hypogaea]|uniref:Bet v I/Major latex protein domain-containing protein n=1 Tax=Arachis hypogaea TaxID=3818 RepID=A0A444YDU0_ARAHY|nr:hypothetical protein Ahy_B07g088131 isoform A [Arachis hypogaea]